MQLPVESYYTESRRQMRHHSLRNEDSLRESKLCVAVCVGSAAGLGIVVPRRAIR